MKCLLCDMAYAGKKFKGADVCAECFNIMMHKRAVRSGYYEIGSKFIIPSIAILDSTREYECKRTEYSNVEATITDQYENKYLLEFDGRTVFVDAGYLSKLKVV